MQTWVLNADHPGAVAVAEFVAQDALSARPSIKEKNTQKKKN